MQGQVVGQISGLVGADGARLVQDLLASASDSGRGLVAGATSAGVLLVWVYFAAQIFLFGAAFTRAQAQARAGEGLREST